jgi:hypothetical protein
MRTQSLLLLFCMRLVTVCSRVMRKLFCSIILQRRKGICSRKWLLRTAIPDNRYLVCIVSLTMCYILSSYHRRGSFQNRVAIVQPLGNHCLVTMCIIIGCSHVVFVIVRSALTAEVSCCRCTRRQWCCMPSWPRSPWQVSSALKIPRSWSPCA